MGTLSIMRQVGRAKATVWRWRERFMAAGVAGLLQDKSRPPGKTSLPKAVVERVAAPGMYLIGMPFLRRRKSALIAGAASDARDLSDHLVSHLHGRITHDVA